jgi:hypothetical protein
MNRLSGIQGKEFPKTAGITLLQITADRCEMPHQVKGHKKTPPERGFLRQPEGCRLTKR